MSTNSFKDEEILSFFNKTLENNRIGVRATSVMPYAPGADSVQFGGQNVQFSAVLSDFGMGDIGFSSITVRNAERSKEIEVNNQVRLVPTRDGFLSYETGRVGAEAARAKLASIDAITKNEPFKMMDAPKVVQEGKAFTLAQFVVDRPRPKPSEQSLSVSGQSI